MSILNVANMGRLSSDRSVSEYAEGIWGIAPLGTRGSADFQSVRRR